MSWWQSSHLSFLLIGYSFPLILTVFFMSQWCSEFFTVVPNPSLLSIAEIYVLNLLWVDPLSPLLMSFSFSRTSKALPVYLLLTIITRSIMLLNVSHDCAIASHRVWCYAPVSISASAFVRVVSLDKGLVDTKFDCTAADFKAPIFPLLSNRANHSKNMSLVKSAFTWWWNETWVLRETGGFGRMKDIPVRKL